MNEYETLFGGIGEAVEEEFDDKDDKDDEEDSDKNVVGKNDDEKDDDETGDVLL